MATHNFAYENRLIYVEDEDYESGNVPEHKEYVQGCNRNYPSYYLDEYRASFHTLDIVITSAYYSGGCIDYIQDDSYLNNITFCDGYDEDATDTIMRDFKAYHPDYEKVRELAREIGEDWKNYTAYDALQAYLFALEKPEADKIIDKIKTNYGYRELTKTGSFCNGEALYEQIT